MSIRLQLSGFFPLELFTTVIKKSLLTDICLSSVSIVCETLCCSDFLLYDETDSTCYLVIIIFMFIIICIIINNNNSSNNNSNLKLSRDSFLTPRSSFLWSCFTFYSIIIVYTNKHIFLWATSPRGWGWSWVWGGVSQCYGCSGRGGCRMGSDLFVQMALWDWKHKSCVQECQKYVHKDVRFRYFW